MNIDRILQISNDVTEDCVDAGEFELIEVIKFWQKRCDDWNNLHQARMMELTAIVAAHVKCPHP